MLRPLSSSRWCFRPSGTPKSLRAMAGPWPLNRRATNKTSRVKAFTHRLTCFLAVPIFSQFYGNRAELMLDRISKEPKIRFPTLYHTSIVSHARQNLFLGIRVPNLLTWAFKKTIFTVCLVSRREQSGCWRLDSGCGASPFSVALRFAFRKRHRVWRRAAAHPVGRRDAVTPEPT